MQVIKLESVPGASKMTQQVKMLAAVSDDLSSVSRVHVVGVKQFPKVDFCHLCMYRCQHVHTQINVIHFFTKESEISPPSTCPSSGILPLNKQTSNTPQKIPIGIGIRGIPFLGEMNGPSPITRQ